ncbi:MAG: oligopeptidase A [Gammaproteobacteria bacterium]|jgi:oligopeptidase A
MNPLLDTSALPAFAHIDISSVESALDSALEESRQIVEKLSKGPASWEALVKPLEEADEHLSRVWSPVGHLSSVMDSEEIRAAYNACLPKLSEYSTEIGQNQNLFSAFKALRSSDEFEQLDTPQQRLVTNALRDFELSGIALTGVKKIRYAEIQQRKSQLGQKFGENLQDATNAWSKLISDESELAGCPPSAMGMFAQAAEADGKTGWLLNLQMPSYIAVLTYADSRELRAEMYRANCTRASELGSNLEWDNTPIINETLALRHELAQLLGFESYAQLSLATKMAESPQQITDFLRDLAKRSKASATSDLDELKSYAADNGLPDMEAWDQGYWSEKLRQSKYNISEEELRPYFSADNVFEGLFAVVNSLFGITVSAADGVEVYHPDVRFFEVKDANGKVCGQFYLDMYARQHKRGGAWMDVCRSRLQEQIPVAYLTCNATPPVGDKPALLTHDEVVTLFHEFGHGLHHMLTRIQWPSVAGISGVEWDAVELPSQFLENWAWEREALDLFAKHYETGENMPADLFERMQAAKNFQSGMQMLRQVELSLFDFEMHANYQADGSDTYVAEALQKVRDEISISQPPSFNRFQNGFGHIFAGGYAAGYYSYKWAEVLSADAFAAFEETSLFDPATGQKFLDEVLSQGGSHSAAEHFKNFRGRAPQIEALLRHSGIAA